MKTPSKNIIELLLADGFSQSELARAFDVSRQAIHYKIGYNWIKFVKKSTKPMPTIDRWKRCTRMLIVLLRELGASPIQIANTTGYSLNSIHKILATNKLEGKKL